MRDLVPDCVYAGIYGGDIIVRLSPFETWLNVVRGGEMEGMRAGEVG